MASYDSAAAIEGVFDTAAASGEVSQATADAISALISDLQATGGNVAVAMGDTSITTAAAAAAVAAPILMMGVNTSVDATFAADSPVKAIILGKTDTPSNITFQTDDAVTVQLGGAEGDQVTTGAGDDSITFAGGSATVDTGAGDDVITLSGAGSANVMQSGLGNMLIKLVSNLVQATIDAGDGFDQLQLNDARSAHTFEVRGGRFVMHSDSEIVMDNVNVVQFTDAQDQIQDIAVLASTEGQAMVGRLYKVALGREAIDTAGGETNVDGLKFWMDEFDNAVVSSDTASAADLDYVARVLLGCPEFGEKYANVGDEDFVATMMSNIGANVTTVNGVTAAEYAAQLAAGTVTRTDLAIMFAQSDEAVVALGVDGTGYVIEGFAGA